jgi:hypothetical protein
VAQHDDLNVLLVGRRPEPEWVEHAADQQEGERTDDRDDPDNYAAPLLKPQILRLHPFRHPTP